MPRHFESVQAPRQRVLCSEKCGELGGVDAGHACTQHMRILIACCSTDTPTTLSARPCARSPAEAFSPMA